MSPQESITDQHRLLLVAALAESDDARVAWARWRERVVFDDIDATSARLLALLARRPDVIDADDPVHGRVLGIYRRAWVGNERSMAAASVACDALASAGVDVLHVEACTLASMLDDHGTRPLYDVDVCVRRRSMRTALGVLASLGWTAEHRTLRARRQRWPHRLERDGARLRVLDDAPWPGADLGVWDRSRSGSVPGIRFLSAPDAAVHAAIRSIQPWQPAGGYWLVDLVRIADSMGSRSVAGLLDDHDVVRCAESHGALDVLGGAATTADRLLAGP